MEDALLASGVSRTVGVRRASAGNLHDADDNETGAVISGGGAGGGCGCGRDSRAVTAALVVCLGSLNFGTTLGFTSPAEPRIREDLLGGDEQLGALMTSVVSLGALVGALSGGQLSAAFSRRIAIAVSAVPGLLGWLLVAVPRPSWGVGPALTVLVIARVLCGLAVGAQSAVVPVYISEVAPPRLRGLLGCCHQLMIALGVTLVYSLGQAIVAPAAECALCGWRLVAVLCAIPQLLLGAIVLLPSFPESPRWLVANGSAADAVFTLARLRGVAPSDPTVLQELGEIQATVTQDQELGSDSAGWRALFAPEMRGRIVLACGLQAGVQLSGISAVTFYAADIFQRAGLEERADQLATIQTLVGLAVTGLSCVLVDLVGRRPLLLTSQALMLPFLCGLVLYFGLTSGAEPTVCDASRLGWLAVASLYCYVAAFCIGTGCLPWLICAEICPLRLRAKATGLATSVSWLTTYLVAQFFRLLANRIGEAGTFGVFLGCTAGFFLFTFFLLPETRGMSLEAIERSFAVEGTQHRGGSRGGSLAAPEDTDKHGTGTPSGSAPASTAVTGATPPPPMPPLTPADATPDSSMAAPALASFPTPAPLPQESSCSNKSSAVIGAICGYGVIGTAFACYLISMLVREPLFPFRIDCGPDEAENLGQAPCVWNRTWLLVTVADYYTMTACMCGVILASEPRWCAGIAWCLWCCLAGAPTACLWVSLQLWRRGNLSLNQGAVSRGGVPGKAL